MLSLRGSCNTSFVTLLRDISTTGTHPDQLFILFPHDKTFCLEAVCLIFSVTEIKFSLFCRSAIFFPGVFDAMFVYGRDRSIVTNV